MNLTRLTDIFSSEGSLQPTGSNQPFWADAPARAWLVGSGWVDLFIVPVIHGQTGSRTHFLRVHEGQIIFSITPNDLAQALRFQAVGFGNAIVHQLPRERLCQLCAQEACITDISKALDAWIKEVYQQLFDNSLVPDCFQLDSNGPIDLCPGESAQPLEGVLWAKLLKGRVRLAGSEELALSPDDGLVPLTPAVWIQATEPATLSATNTASELRAGAIWPALSGFDARLRNRASLKMRQTLEAEASRLLASNESRRSALTTAVAHLAGSLAVRREELAALRQHGDPGLDACQVLTEALGVANPQSMPSPGRDPDDTISRWARRVRLRLRRVLLIGKWWTQDNGPLLAFTQANHRPVALLPVTPTRYTLADPTNQSRQTVTRQLAQTLNPLAYSFYRSFQETAPKIWDVFRFGLRNTLDDQRMVILLSVAGGLLAMAMPLATGLIFDTIIPSDYRPQLWFIALVLLAAGFGAVIFDVTRGIALLRLETKSDVAIQGAVWDRLLSLPLRFFRQYTAGDLAMRANGINAIQQILSGAVITSILGAIFSVFNFGLLFYYSVRLAAVASALALLNLSVMLLASWAGLRLQRPLYELQGKISGHVLQFITGISKLRVAAAEPRAFAVWAKAFGEQKKLDLKMGALANAVTVFNESYPVLTSICLFGVVAFGLEPGITTGRFLAFNVAFLSFLYAGLSAGEALISILQTVPIYERARPILQALPEVREMKADPGALRGSLELNRVSFRYKAEGPLVLNDLSFQISAGEFVALVGPSGMGKSTVMRLLLGFEVPESGTIRYDGLDLAGLDVQAVRRQIGVVLQNGKLMPGDIFENIVGSGLFTLDEAWEAARKAGLEEDIRQMPMGMHTVLGETAGTLSGGQRQRLMIARALVAKPRILLFDEATSALDNRTQAIVTESLKQLQATRLVIAHRLSTIMSADRIFVLQQGKVVQTGSYQSLLEQPGPFAEFARRQLA